MKEYRWGKNYERKMKIEKETHPGAKFQWKKTNIHEEKNMKKRNNKRWK
jgi:hypothetical protein